MPKVRPNVVASTGKFVSRNYLSVTFFVFLAVSVALAVVIYDLLKPGAETRVREAVNFIFMLVGFGILLSWPRWLLARLNKIVRSAVEALRSPDDTADRDFKKRIGSKFGDELVSNIITYEAYCRNEYILDMQKHHLAWLMLAVAGAITIVAALLVIFSGGNEGLKWIQAVGVTLPALVTGVLLKIWLETRENLKKTRERTDFIYRQRLRLLLLVGDHVQVTRSTWADAIALNTKLLEYINSAESSEEARAAGV